MDKSTGIHDAAAAAWRRDQTILCSREVYSIDTLHQLHLMY